MPTSLFRTFSREILVTILFLVGRVGAQPTWIELTIQGTAQQGRDNPGAVYDPLSNRLIVFGGDADTGPCCTYFNDTWVLANANGLGGTPSWIQLSPAAPSGLPPGRNSLSVVYDATSNRMILFAGGQFGGNVYATLFNDVWVLTNANGLGGTPTWLQLAPVGGPPPPRAGQEAVYDEANNRMIIYGGGDNGIEDVPTDVWVLTNANGLGGTPTWLEFSPPNGAPVEEHYSTGYDPNTNRMIFFGGCCYWTNASWVLANANGVGVEPMWMPQSPGGTPPAIRQTAAYGYNPANNSLVIFGGSAAGTAYNDTWLLSNADGATGVPAWSNLIPNNAKGSPPIISGQLPSIGSGFDVVNERLISLENTPVSGGSVILQPWVLKLEPAQTGLIEVYANSSTATFTISGPMTYSGSGRSFVQSNAPPGAYTITYGQIENYVTPGPQTLTLDSDGRLTFFATYGINAVDVACKAGDLYSSTKLNDLENAGVQAVVVNAWPGVQKTSQCLSVLQDQLYNVMNAGLNIAAYCALSFDNPDGQIDPTDGLDMWSGGWQVDQALANIGSVPVAFLAIDVEIGGGFGASLPSDRITRIQEALKEVVAKGITPIIYTDSTQWSTVTQIEGDTNSVFSGYPLWDSFDDFVESLTLDGPYASGCPDGQTGSQYHWVPYGGWSRRLGKQYNLGCNRQGTSIGAAANLDIDVFDTSLFGLP